MLFRSCFSCASCRNSAVKFLCLFAFFIINFCSVCHSANRCSIQAKAQFRYINPLPANTGEILARFKRVIVAELNSGQFADYLQARFPEVNIRRINKVEGQPFLVKEVVDGVKNLLS